MKINSDNGFTLIEILIAISILSIGIFSVASMQISAIKGNSSADRLTRATTIAQDKIEQLISVPYNNADLQDINGDGNAGLRNPFPPLPALAIPDTNTYPTDYQITDGEYTVYWNISVDDPMDNNKIINVIVTWPYKGTTRNVVIRYIKLPS
ncbi:MAG: prepilin-type N-terminal cleavage/methylation domain-containing protein [Thermodesulfobacteriota bacterium]|nr:prepilin-type N-terminal cleavage/methylation domain-containing protein [Thermodesulfobacteriota bacterium]